MRWDNLLCGLMLIMVIAILPGCKGHSIVDFENPEIPLVQNLNSVSKEIRKRYSVGDVCIIPWIKHSLGGSTDSDYTVMINALSPEEVEVEIKKLSLVRDGKSVALESPFSNRRMNEFKFDESYQAYYAHLYSPSFIIPAPNDTKKLHLILSVEVKKEGKTTNSGFIEATFVPRKRTYFFPQA